MNQCFITGGNGFLGKYLVDGLLSRGYQLTLLLRDPQLERNTRLIERWQQQIEQYNNGASLQCWRGDISHTGLGLTTDQSLSSFDAVYHLAAIYDLDANAEQVMTTNVAGTEYLLEKMELDGFSGALHFVSSIAVAGGYQGEFNETMFDEGQTFPHCYHESKYQSEALIRQWREAHSNCDVRIYRPSAIVGHSKTGEIDKLDGPYYLFSMVSAIKKYLPAWVPLVAPKLRGILDMVPVDYVADALIAISDLGPEQIPDAQFCFHLTDPNSPDMLRTFKAVLRSADGPRIKLEIPTGLGGNRGTKKKSSAGGLIGMLAMARQLKGIKLIQNSALNRLEIPESVFEAMMPSTGFGAEATLALLDKQNVRPPAFRSYVDNLWDYYNRHLDPAKSREPKSRKAFAGKTVVITGGSSGIGLASAERALRYGANVILIARDEGRLSDSVSSLLPFATENGVTLEAMSCDLSRLEDCDALVARILNQYGSVDILFNNAGRSIRRSIDKSQDRFHDLERTMQLNYFGAARLMLSLLPAMIDNGGGHILHSSTMGTMAPTPRFGPYLASKCALDALMDSIAAEYANRGIFLTSIKYPLVKTAMIAPTSDYNDAPAASPEFAAQMFVDAVVDKPRKQISGLGTLMGSVSLFAPSLITQLYNYGFQIWPDEKTDFPDMAIDRALVTSAISKPPF